MFFFIIFFHHPHLYCSNRSANGWIAGFDSQNICRTVDSYLFTVVVTVITVVLITASRCDYNDRVELFMYLPKGTECQRCATKWKTMPPLIFFVDVPLPKNIHIYQNRE